MLQGSIPRPGKVQIHVVTVQIDSHSLMDFPEKWLKGEEIPASGGVAVAV
jgi:hypothetical protein